MRIELSQQWHCFAERVAPWLAFLALVLWVFPPKGLTEGLASYGDPLEILWSVEHHCRALAEGNLFLRAPEVLYPFGLNLFLYPHWMGVNLIFTPFCPIPNRIAVLNFLVLAAVAGIFAGVFHIARGLLEIPPMPSTLAAASLTFFPLQFFQTCEHIDKLFGLVALTWLWVLVLRAARTPSSVRWQWGLGMGWLWGIAVLFSLYFFWLGLLPVVLLLAKTLWREKRFTLAILVGVASVSVPWGMLFLRATQELALRSSLYNLYMYAASPDLWLLPSPYHLWWGKGVRALLDPQALEGSLGMLGPVPFLLGLGGFLAARRYRHPLLPSLAWTTLAGLILSLGVYLKWRTRLVHVPQAEMLHRLLWQLGHFLKPALFPTPEPPPGMADLLPLPGFLWILLPFAEGGRAMVRYLFIAAPGLFLAAGYGLSRISPRILRWGLGVLWASDLLLTPIVWKPLSLHPALEWLAQQPTPGAIFSLDRTGMAWNPRELWGSLSHRHPLIHSSGSWVPPHLGALTDVLLNGRFDFAIGELQQLGMEYLLIHRDGPLAETLYGWARESSRLRLVQCFPPPPQDSPWPGEICVFRSASPPAEHRPFLFLKGWSLPEEWGFWAEGEQSDLLFWWEGKGEAVLEFLAFPLCLPDEHQKMEIEVNGSLWRAFSFESCDPVEFRETIPRELLRRYNLVSFRYAYARSLAEIPTLQSGDPRRLAVGFLNLQIRLEP